MSFVTLLLFCLHLWIQFFSGFFLISSLRIKMSHLERVVVSLALGITLWSAQGYIFGYLHARWLSYVYVGAVVLWSLFKYADILKFFRDVVNDQRERDLTSMWLLIIGSVIQIIQMIGTGILSQDGMRFFRVHAQDGIFHLSLIASIARVFPPVEPGAASLLVQNYHYWSDLWFAETFRVFGVPIHTLFFQYTPPLLALFTGLALIVLVNGLFVTANERLRILSRRFALFFLFFGSDSAYLIMLALHRTFGFYTSAIDNGATQFLNMPHAFAKFLFLTALWAFLRWTKSKSNTDAVVTILLGAVLFGMKIYFAFVFGSILGIYAVLELFSSRGKAMLSYLKVGVPMVLAGLAIYLPPNHGSGGLDWYPLEWVKLMIAKENLDWMDLRYRIAIAQYYHLGLKKVAYEVIGTLATLISIHGMRLIGFSPSKKMIHLISPKIWVSFLLTSLLCTFLGLFTLQRSGGFNVFNFFASSLPILAILGAIWCAVTWERPSWVGKSIVVLICILSLPRIVYESVKILESYRTDTDVTLISSGELDALRFIEEVSDSNDIVQSSPDNALDVHTPYVSYFTNRESYIAGVNVLETHNQPIEREEKIKKLFHTTDANQFSSEMKTLGITYLYLKKGEQLPLDPRDAGLKLIFENSASMVYTVKTIEEGL